VSSLRPAISRRAIQLLLAGLLVFVLGWDVWAVVQDRRLTGSDTFTPKLVELATSLEQGQLRRWLRAEDPKGPVPAVLALPLLYAVGDGPLAARLLSVLSHGGLILLAFALARQIGGRRSAGLWAALLCATSPMVFGWCRLDYPEPLLALLLLAALLLMMQPRLPWLALGVCLALALMVKLSLAVLMLGPALWLAVRHLHHIRQQGAWRALLPPILCGAVFLALIAPWLLHNLQMVLVNLNDTHHELAMMGRTRTLGYLHLPTIGPLLAMALLALAVLWSDGTRQQRWQLALLGSCIVASLVIFLTSFTYWSRYLMPTTTVMAVVAGAGLDRAQHRLRPRVRQALGVAAAVLLTGQLAVVSLVGLPTRLPREHYSGLLTPDRRPHDGYQRALSALQRLKQPMLVVYDSVFAMHRTEGIDAIWRRRNLALPVIPPRDLITDYQPGQELSVLLVSGMRDPDRSATDLSQLVSREAWRNMLPHDTELLYYREVLSWLARQKEVRQLVSTTDPGDLRYVALQVTCDGVPPHDPAVDDEVP